MFFSFLIPLSFSEAVWGGRETSCIHSRKSWEWNRNVFTKVCSKLFFKKRKKKQLFASCSKFPHRISGSKRSNRKKRHFYLELHWGLSLAWFYLNALSIMSHSFWIINLFSRSVCGSSVRKVFAFIQKVLIPIRPLFCFNAWDYSFRMVKVVYSFYLHGTGVVRIYVIFFLFFEKSCKVN